MMVEGDDVDPQFYRTTLETQHLIRETDALKDGVEFRLLRFCCLSLGCSFVMCCQSDVRWLGVRAHRHCLKQELPILGICRGSQLLNLACGGALYNDVMAEIPSTIDHRSVPAQGRAGEGESN